MNKIILVLAGIVIIAIIGFSAFPRDDMNKEKREDVVKNDEIADEQIEQIEENAMNPAGSYEEYSAEKVAIGAASGDVVLFFHASWCPSCRLLNSDIEQNVGNIPLGVTILKTDYDEQTELKKKYGVTTQHTLVQVDKDGNLIKKWSGGSKLEDLLLQIQ